jgi:hypothetical protein
MVRKSTKSFGTKMAQHFRDCATRGAMDRGRIALHTGGTERLMGEGRIVPSAISITNTMEYWVSAQICTFREMRDIAVMAEECG